MNLNKRTTLLRPFLNLSLMIGLLACTSSPKKPNSTAPPEKKAAYCLDVALSWGGQPVEGGRLPAYGAEVPNISYAEGQEPDRAKVVRLGGQPLLELEALFLNNNSQNIQLRTKPNLPLEAGALEVKLSLQVCPAREGGWAEELLTTEKEATRMVRFSEPVPSWQGQSLYVSHKEQYSAELSPGRPVTWKLSFEKFQGTAAPAVPERAIFIERTPTQKMEISITRPANQSWSFDWM